MHCTSSDVAFSDAEKEKQAGVGMHICSVFKSIISVLVAQSFRNRGSRFYNTEKIFQPENSCEDGGLLSSKSDTELPCKRATVTKRHQSRSIMCLTCHCPIAQFLKIFYQYILILQLSGLPGISIHYMVHWEHNCPLLHFLISSPFSPLYP